MLQFMKTTKAFKKNDQPEQAKVSKILEGMVERSRQIIQASQDGEVKKETPPQSDGEGKREHTPNNLVPPGYIVMKPSDGVYYLQKEWSEQTLGILSGGGPKSCKAREVLNSKVIYGPDALPPHFIIPTGYLLGQTEGGSFTLVKNVTCLTSNIDE